MYEFFFSNILLKGMILPFFENMYMVGFFEKIIRKRAHAREKKAFYKRPNEKRKYLDDLRRERTLRLRKFFEFFSLLYDSRIYNPFSQFVDHDFLKQFKAQVRAQMTGQVPLKTSRKAKHSNSHK